MKIRALLPTAFGKFHADSPILLENGLNIIHGLNEAGKSTLQDFIQGMFFGFKREGRSRVSRLPQFERYRPWVGSDYKGIIVYDHEGRRYRLERSFDPDSIRIMDDDTGEDLTGSFTQDVRREYDFPQRHLGMSFKEFRNTVWIGQLGSAQEPGLAAEIQDKLQSILGGGAEDVSLAKALSSLEGERSRIKTPRSTRARLDLLLERLETLETEASIAAAREEEVRGWMLQSSNLGRLRERLENDLQESEKELKRLRRSFLGQILSKAEELEDRIGVLEPEIAKRTWAADLPSQAEEEYRTLNQGLVTLGARIAETEAALEEIAVKARPIREKLDSLSGVTGTGLDEAALAALYGRYTTSRATASKGERLANEARRGLRDVEGDASAKDLMSRDLGDEVLKRAEELRETRLLAEKERGNLDLEVEKAKATVAAVNPGGASGWIYALALGVLGIAVFLTTMGMPLSVPAFLVAVAVFCAGVVRQSKTAKAKRENQKVLDEIEALRDQQIGVIDKARAAELGYLDALSVSSIEELKTLVRETARHRARLKSAKDRYDLAHHYWFEASQDLSAAEKELLGVLKEAGCAPRNGQVTDGAVEVLRTRLAQVASLSASLRDLSARERETKTLLAGFCERKDSLDVEMSSLCRGSGVRDGEELSRKIEAKAKYDDLYRTWQNLEERRAAILGGRSQEEIKEEIAFLSRAVEDHAGNIGAAVSEKEYQDKRAEVDSKKAKMAEISAEIAALEKGIRLRGDEGRPLAQIFEETERIKSFEEELLIDKDALEMAYTVLDELSKNIRREFAPALNRRVGEVLKEITGGKYEDVKISADLEMNVIHPATSEVTEIASLSGGTLDQCYFALRVAVAEIVTGNRSFPLFLDDPFVQYDDQRLEGALRVLSSLSKQHQVILFSCHNREGRIAQRLGLEYNALTI